MLKEETRAEDAAEAALAEAALAAAAAWVAAVRAAWAAEARTAEEAAEEAEEATKICGKTIQHDANGVGSNWRTIDAGDLPANIAEDIAAEILDGGHATCSDYVAVNGLRYRWS